MKELEAVDNAVNNSLNVLKSARVLSIIGLCSHFVTFNNDDLMSQSIQVLQVFNGSHSKYYFFCIMSTFACLVAADLISFSEIIVKLHLIMSMQSRDSKKLEKVSIQG